MRGRTRWVLVAAVFVAVLAFQPAPAEGAENFPERWSIVWFDAEGSLMECTDIGKCTAHAGCPAYAFFADKWGHCDYKSEEFEAGRYQLENCTWNNVDWSFFAPNTRQLHMDLSCSRWGGPFFWVDSGGGVPPASCGAGVTYKRVDQYGLNYTANEGYGGVTIGGRRSCSTVFRSMPPEALEDFDVEKFIRHRWFR